MEIFKNNIRIKVLLFMIALLCSIIFFSINWYLVNQFRFELNKQVNTIIDIYHDKLTNENIDSDYILKTLLPLIDDLDIPMIITTKTSEKIVYESININFEFSKNEDKYIDEISNITSLMDKNNEPLTIVEVNNQPIIQLHYGDSIIINNLRWISYLEFGFIFFIIILFVSSLYLILSSEKNYIYAGMAREAAHQLGTPISSLMGWLKLLETKNTNTKEIYKSMKNDVNKLENISHKFNKIGSTPTLKKIELLNILNDVSEYYKSKLPKSSNIQIDFKESYNHNYFIMGDSVLLYWAFENIIKNSIDSINSTKGKIILSILKDKNYIIIDFFDNGKGISRKNKDNIFKPGYSTKQRGWGLGLNLSKRIINNFHKGSIILLKSNKNETVFRIKLRTIVP